MATRSGKRIHRSFHEAGSDVVVSLSTMSERKTRNKKQKENNDVNVAKPKLRENYVRYPSEDDDDQTEAKDERQRRKLRKNTLLKDLNFDSIIENTKNEILKEVVVRETRRTKKFVDEPEQVHSIVKSKKKLKGKNKLKRISAEKLAKSKKSKNGENNSIDNKTGTETNVDDTSNISVTSYCTAIGSPVHSMEKEDGTLTELAETPTDIKTNNTSPTVIPNNMSNNINDQAKDEIDIISKINSPDVADNLTEDICGQATVKDNTFEIDKSDQNNADCINTTFDKSVENINISDDSKTENILNNTPLLVESSMDTSSIPSSRKSSSTPTDTLDTPPITPLRREGTFTKESPTTDLNGTFTMGDSPSTPEKRSVSVAGNTPYHSNGKRKLDVTHSVERPLNMTHSIEKPRNGSIVEMCRQTRVMFCSPANNALMSTQNKNRIIKSSMKGSNKSFVYDQDASSTAKRSGARKRSFTHGDAEDRAKRLRLTEDLANSVNRLSRPRSTSAGVKSSQKDVTTPTSKGTPYNNKSEKLVRSKLPNFAALHQKHFEKMESLDECQLRKAKRAKKLMSPSTRLARLLEKKKGQESLKPQKKNPPVQEPKPTLESLIPRPTFRFNANYHINPFSAPIERKPQKALKRELSQPSMKGSTLIEKKIGVKDIREKNIQEKRNEYRNIIKGVRTNRRFELQMKSRNLQA